MLSNSAHYSDAPGFICSLMSCKLRTFSPSSRKSLACQAEKVPDGPSSGGAAAALPSVSVLGACPVMTSMLQNAIAVSCPHSRDFLFLLENNDGALVNRYWLDGQQDGQAAAVPWLPNCCLEQRSKQSAATCGGMLCCTKKHGSLVFLHAHRMPNNLSKTISISTSRSLTHTAQHIELQT
jgi:hypothetical protein